MIQRRVIAAVVIGMAAVGAVMAAGWANRLLMGRQPDGTFLVSSGRFIEPGTIAFEGRAIDIAMHPREEMVAVLHRNSVFLADTTRVLPGSRAALAHGASFRGCAWHPDGARLYVSVSQGYVQELRRDNWSLTVGRRLTPAPADARGNPRPGGMALTRDGRRLFVAAMDRNTVAELDTESGEFVREWPTQNLPFAVRLSEDERTLIVTNWAGRPPRPGEETRQSVNATVLADKISGTASGTVSFIERETGAAQHVEVGKHPTALEVAGDRVYVANSASDSVSVVDAARRRVLRTIPMKWRNVSLFGAMPVDLAARGETLYVCCGGDNALAEVDLRAGAVKGYQPVGYYPVSVALTHGGGKAIVLNTKGNGSVANTSLGRPGNAHDFQGTLSVVDLQADLAAATARVAQLNHWEKRPSELRPNLAVYKGAIQHVVYIIKENRTYDEIFGDMPQGNGDPSLCGLGEEITPNHHALARQFTLFDNGYVSGTNSADGHCWTDMALANDYLERFYTGYRTYPDDGDDPMGMASSGAIWDAALKKGRTLRIYGEFCDDEDNKVIPEPKSWLEVWRDRQNGGGKFRFQSSTDLKHLRRYIHPNYLYWPLWQSDQHRADLFIAEYKELSRKGKVPNLMILSLPSDHTEGRDPRYPKPQSMVADNDLALGRIVEAITHSPEWKKTCILVIEDDAQAGPDHVDGHRTVFMAISPYTRRGYVDSTFYTTVSMLRTIELMLGLDPMNRFDALTPPLSACFTNVPDYTPYKHLPNRIPLDDMNPPLAGQRGMDRHWTQVSLSLDWSRIDGPDQQKLNHVLWYTLHGPNRPYPIKKTPR